MTLHVHLALVIVMIMGNFEAWVIRYRRFMVHQHIPRTIRCFTTSTLNAQSSISPFPSSIRPYNIWGREIFVKHDDELSIPGLEGEVCGNKIRKFKSLLTKSTLPQTIISCGGSQSNAMRALAMICNKKKLHFIYLTTPVSQSLRLKPRGNFAGALNAGMQLVELLHQKDCNKIRSFNDAVAAISHGSSAVPSFNPETTLFIPQGGASIDAKAGIDELCRELESFIQPIFQSDQKPWKLLFASGTGTMSLFSARYFRQNLFLHKHIQVINIPCASSRESMLQDLVRLDDTCGSVQVMPEILEGCFPNRKFRFGNLDPLHFKIWQYLAEEHHLVFDLLYAPRAFELLLIAAGNSPRAVSGRITELCMKNLFPDHHILYYHCGGIEGNDSQLLRYKYAGIK